MESNFYNHDPDENKSYQKTVAMCVAAASAVILLFLVVLYVNSDDDTPKAKPQTAAKQETVQEEETKEDDILSESHNLTSKELEFWEDAKKPTQVPEEEEGELTPYKDPDAVDDSASAGNDKDDRNDNSKDNNGKDNTKDKKDTDSPGSEEGEGSLNKNNDTDDLEDKEGYITVTDDNGKKRYYEILTDAPKNDYDLKNDLINENGMLTYKDNRRESIKGVDLSKYNGTVDFNKLKENGIGFVMLRLGSRGYGTGKISLDEKFVEYAQNAQLAGIQIGAYFYSQAINETEAIEEANYIVGAVSGFNVKYPIAIDVERVAGDEARTDKLTDKERTAIVKSFCDAVKGYGYKPIIYSSKDLLVSGLNLEDLADYDVWLSDESIPTDYPYRFSMWQYNKRGRIDGITGDIDLDMSFIDYEQK